MRLSVSDIIEATGGFLLEGDETGEVTSINTDSRNLGIGEVFLALKGDNFDGHDYLKQVIGSGARGIIISRPDALREIPERPSKCWILLVNDTLRALGDIAHLWRKRVPLDTLAVIAGSAGKTTTKEMIGSILEKDSKALVSTENYNNLIGVPLNLFRLEEHHRIAVLEIGMNLPGELYRLTEITEPDIAAMVNIGTAHIGQFGGELGLLHAKGELIDSLSQESLLIYNNDCAMTKKLLKMKTVSSPTLRFAVKGKGEITATDIQPEKPCGFSFTLKALRESIRTRINVFGEHNIYNALCAAAVLYSMGIRLETIGDGLSQFKPFKLRSQVEEYKGISLVLDCYNSSPDAAIQTIKSLKTFSMNKRRSIAVLGDMLELGEMEHEMHNKIGETCVREGIDVVVAVGSTACLIAQRVAEKRSQAYYFRRQEEAAEFLGELLEPGDVVLFKASRKLKFEDLVNAVKRELNEKLDVMSGRSQ